MELCPFSFSTLSINTARAVKALMSWVRPDAPHLPVEPKQHKGQEVYCPDKPNERKPFRRSWYQLFVTGLDGC